MFSANVSPVRDFQGFVEAVVREAGVQNAQPSTQAGKAGKNQMVEEHDENIES